MVWRQSDDLLARGLIAFSKGLFFEAQALWEAEALAASMQTRPQIQALATIAAGMLALDEQRLTTAERLLSRGAAALAFAPNQLGGVDISAVRAAADVMVTAVRRGDPADARGVVASAS
jgi:hypothetical protein